MIAFITVVILIVGSFIVMSSINRLIFYYPGGQDEIHFAKTEDGHLITLYHYFPRQLEKGRPPVLLCHGLSANHFTWDPGPCPSFAKYIRDNGFDAWVIDLRGRGPSARLQQRRGETKPGGWNYDDYVQYDLPAVINYVREQTGSDQVNWVGHSMGGMVMYGYLQSQDASLIRSATAVASPARMKNFRFFKFLMGPFQSLLGRMSHFRQIQGARAIALLGYLVPTKKVGTHKSIYPWFAVNGVANPSAAVMAQFNSWMINEHLANADASQIYSDGFHKITTPFLVVEGAGDWMAPPLDVKYGIDRMSSKDKKYAFFSKKNGHKHNYDHMSILLGDSAAEEVWPVMLDWLKDHS